MPRFRALLLTISVIPAAFSADPPYRYFLTGNAADVQTRTTPGFALVGGGKDQDAVCRWFLQRSGGGDIVVLRASGADGYNSYFKDLVPVDSVETLVVSTPEAARDPFVADRIRKAEALFIAGGDQWNYVRVWNHTPVSEAIQYLIDKGVPVGGTSAGLAVLAEDVYTAEKDTVTSAQALANPFHERVTVGTDFLHIPALKGAITDSHFHARDRMGRTLVFLARMLDGGKLAEARAIAVDERTAALTEKDGRMTVEGEGSVFMIRARKPAEILKPGTPLTFHAISVYRIPRGGDFDLQTWTGHGGAAYTLDVENGAIHSTQSGGGIY